MVAEMKKHEKQDWLTIGIIGAFALLVATALLVCPAKSHSWYDQDCCSDRDCEPVHAISFVAADDRSLPVMVVTTSFGTKPLTSKTKIRESKDSQMHACIYQGALICLYMPPGN